VNTIKLIYVVLLAICLPVSAVSAGEQRVIAFAQDTMTNDFRKAQVMRMRKVRRH